MDNTENLPYRTDAERIKECYEDIKNSQDIINNEKHIIVAAMVNMFIMGVPDSEIADKIAPAFVPEDVLTDLACRRAYRHIRDQYAIMTINDITIRHIVYPQLGKSTRIGVRPLVDHVKIHVVDDTKDVDWNTIKTRVLSAIPDGFCVETIDAQLIGSDTDEFVDVLIDDGLQLVLSDRRNISNQT